MTPQNINKRIFGRLAKFQLVGSKSQISLPVLCARKQISYLVEFFVMLSILTVSDFERRDPHLFVETTCSLC